MSATDITEPDEPRRKSMKTHRAAYMDSQFRSPEFLSCFAEAFLSKSYQKDDHTGTEVFATPFRHASLPNLIPDREFIEELIAELKGLEMQDKNNDLYKFKQSIDLKHVNSSRINIFREILQEQMLPWLMDVTRFPLNDKVDMFCSNYDYTDTLLCHDDELEGRYIAYIYYLVPDSWCKEDGGTLDLFDTDDKGQPNSIVKSIVPAKNLFLFFEVTPGSYHQVAEILAEDKTRLAISGWFHGPPVGRPAPYVEPPMPVSACGSIREISDSGDEKEGSQKQGESSSGNAKSSRKIIQMTSDVINKAVRQIKSNLCLPLALRESLRCDTEFIQSLQENLAFLDKCLVPSTKYKSCAEKAWGNFHKACQEELAVTAQNLQLQRPDCFRICLKVFEQLIHINYYKCNTQPEIQILPALWF